MDEGRFRAGLAAKMDVSVRIAQVFQHEALDFVLCFSSLQSFSKSPAGQLRGWVHLQGCLRALPRSPLALRREGDELGLLGWHWHCGLTGLSGAHDTGGRRVD